LLLLCCAGIFSGRRATAPGKFETSTFTKFKHSITVRGKNIRWLHLMTSQSAVIPFGVSDPLVVLHCMKFTAALVSHTFICSRRSAAPGCVFGVQAMMSVVRAFGAETVTTVAHDPEESGAVFIVAVPLAIFIDSVPATAGTVIVKAPACDCGETVVVPAWLKMMLFGSIVLVFAASDSAFGAVAVQLESSKIIEFMALVAVKQFDVFTTERTKE
jgi:hypothetical protein